jgi:hypothetical protein
MNESNTMKTEWKKGKPTEAGTYWIAKWDYVNSCYEISVSTVQIFGDPKHKVNKMHLEMQSDSCHQYYMDFTTGLPSPPDKYIEEKLIRLY